MPKTAIPGYRIRRWETLYEPRPHENRGQRELTFVKDHIAGHAHAMGSGWRELVSKDATLGCVAFTLFVKLRELAANWPRDYRDGFARTKRPGRYGEPCTIEDISFYTLIPQDLVQKALPLLLPETGVGWVEHADAAVRPQRENGRQAPRAASRVTRKTTPATKDETKDETEDIRHKTSSDSEQTACQQDSASPSDSIHPVPGSSDSIFGPRGEPRDQCIRQATTRLCTSLGVGSRKREQRRSDVTTILDICRQAIKPDDPYPKETMDRLVNEADRIAGSIGVLNKVGLFVRIAKDKFGYTPASKT